MSEASKFFNNVNKSELANLIALTAIFKSHDLETKQLEDAFINYAKSINDLKICVLRQLEQTEAVDDVLGKLKVKVKGNA